MSALASLWRFFDARPRPVAVLSEWRQVLGESFDSVRPLLQPTGETAMSYPHPIPYEPPLAVVEHGDGAVVAVCREGTGTRVPLVHSDLAIFGVDWRRLRVLLANALQVSTSRAPIEERSLSLTVGHWEPKRAASFPVQFVRCMGRRQMEQVLPPLMAMAAKPTLLLTPTREHWPEGLQALCQRFKCVVASLDEVVAGDAAQCQATDAWPEYLAAFCGYADLSLPQNYQNRKPAPMRGVRLAATEKLEEELEAHIIAARDQLRTLHDQGRELVLLPVPTQKDLAKRTGLTETAVSRCVNDKRAEKLTYLLRLAESLDGVWSYRLRR